LKPFLCVALVLAFTSACGRFGGQGRSKTAATATPTPRQRLETAADQTAALSSFHFLLTHQNGASNIVLGLAMTRADGDFVKPDRFRATVHASFQGFPVAVKVINVGNQTWITNPLQGVDRYQLVPNGAEAAAILDPGTGILKAARNVRNPRLAATDKIDSAETYVILGEVDAGDLRSVATDAQAGRMVPTRVWIGRDNGLLYRNRLERDLSEGQTNNIVLQIDTSQCNEKLDIGPPG